ncbi:MAG TPA: hypothetical protein VFK62_02415 [Gaiellaceae bacterium]|nr:hypothetical protein [Gaiellaceae bacterium]
MQESRDPRARVRDLGLARLRRTTRLSILGATALAGAFAGAAAHSNPGHKAPAAAARAARRRATVTAQPPAPVTQAPTTEESTPTAAPPPPPPPPVATTAPPVASTGAT